MKPLLVVAHEATRTGSPVVLERLLRHLRDHWDIALAVRLLAQGPMSERLLRLGDVDPTGVQPSGVLINSALAAEYAWTVEPDVPIVIYVHEEGDALRQLPERGRAALAKRCETVLCVSEGSRRDLLALGVEDRVISLLPPVIAAREIPSDVDKQRARAEHGLRDAGRLVVACGEAGWRKGADLFIDVCRRLDQVEPCEYVWVGRRPRAFARVLDHDTATAGLEGRLHWLGDVERPDSLLGAADVFVLPSREDPQPLVPLEAAQCGTPTVGFDIGGLRTLADEGSAVKVPYPDTAGMAGAVGALFADAGRSARLTASARNRIAALHAPEVVGDRFVEVLISALRSGRDSDDASPTDRRRRP